MKALQKLRRKRHFRGENCEFMDKEIMELKSQTDKTKGNVKDTRRKLLLVMIWYMGRSLKASG